MAPRKRPRSTLAPSDFHIEAELAAILSLNEVSTGGSSGDSSGSSSSIAPSSNQLVVVDADGDSEEDDEEGTIKALQELAIVLSAANGRIEQNPYSAHLKSDLENLIVDAKMLESYMEFKQPEGTPPCSFPDLVAKWLLVKPMVELFK